MARRGTEKRRLPGQVLVRLTADQQRAVGCLAEARQVSIATWVRTLIANAINVDAGPILRRAHPPELVLEIAYLREVVAELGGALVQSAVAARKDGRAVEHAEIEAIIPHVKAVVVDLDRLKEKLWRPAA